MSDMSDKARILAALRKGPVRKHDWVRFPAPDGGAPMLHPGARILDLRKDGYTIDTRERKPSALWVLVAEPDSSPAQVCGASPADTGRLSAETSGLIPSVAKRGLAAALAEFDEEDGDDWWEEAA